MAGITLLAIAVPLNIGYAQIAGLPPTAGLYALIVPVVLYALLVSSRQLVASPDAAAAALVASSVGGLAIAGSADYVAMAMAQAILSGLFFIAASVFRLGYLASFLSTPILIGFVGGLALDILVSQVAKMLGVKIDSGGSFTEKIFDLISGLGTASLAATGISVVAVTVLLIGRRLARAVPWALIVLVGATVLVASSGLADAGVAVLGPVEAGLPAPRWPMLDLATWIALVPTALALTLVTTAEGLLVARAYAEKQGVEHRPDQDLFAFGIANIASGASGSFAVGSSTSRTAAMDQAGSRTQLPTIVMAAGVLLLLLFGTALLEDIPMPAIGAVVAVAIVPLLGLPEFGSLWRRDRFEFVIGAVCFIVTLFVGAISGIFVSFVLALINVARRAARPAVDILVDDGAEGSTQRAPFAPTVQSAPGILLVRVAGPLFFANSAVVVDNLKRLVTTRAQPVHWLILDLEAVSDIDITAADALSALRDWLAERDVQFRCSRGHGRVVDRMRRWGVLDGDAVYPTNRAALAAARRE